MKKKAVKKKISNKKNRKIIFWKKGKAELPILGVIMVFGIALAGGLLFSFKDKKTSFTSTSSSPLCCNSGDGANCHPLNDAQNPPLTYNGVQYGLLKSQIILKEGGNHLKDTGMKFGANNDPVIVNTTDGFRKNNGSKECGANNDDQIWNTGGQQPECVPIPNDEIVYVCRANCHPTVCTKENVGDIDLNNTTFCYGDAASVYDVYFRLNDFPNPGVPNPIKNCIHETSTISAQLSPPQVSITIGPYAEHKSLQLHDFRFLIPNGSQNVETLVSPYCKPAIYLYPPKTEQISVKIAPQGQLKLTIPQYPQNGWNVTVNPTGNITYQGSNYDYLFYEAALSDNLVTNNLPNTGYVTAYDKLPDFFAHLLPSLGLNIKEQAQFTDYWLKALPKNPYYRISVVPQKILDSLSPLTIVPNPDTMIRVTLYFQPLDNPIKITPPVLPTITRNGFTVVEWGGLFKQDKNHPFTCLM